MSRSENHFSQDVTFCGVLKYLYIYVSKNNRDDAYTGNH